MEWCHVGHFATKEKWRPSWSLSSSMAKLGTVPRLRGCDSCAKNFGRLWCWVNYWGLVLLATTNSWWSQVWSQSILKLNRDVRSFASFQIPKSIHLNLWKPKAVLCRKCRDRAKQRAMDMQCIAILWKMEWVNNPRLTNVHPDGAAMALLGYHMAGIFLFVNSVAVERFNSGASSRPLIWEPQSSSVGSLPKGPVVCFSWDIFITCIFLGIARSSLTLAAQEGGREQQNVATDSWKPFSTSKFWS